MTWKECKKLIRSDYVRLNHIKWGMVRYLFTNASFKITFWFRIGCYLKSNRRLANFVYPFIAVIYKHYQVQTGIQMKIGTKVGGGLMFAHYGTIVINPDAVIGVNCKIFQGVTIGSIRGKGVPVIGDNCVLFSGSNIIGNIKLGNNVIVGAGAVVINDIPDNAVVAGVPAKIVNFNGKEISQLYL